MSKLMGIIVLSAVSFAAQAHGTHWWHAPPARAPEIDPASALSALTLLAGSLAVLRGRRNRK
jgi:hypothetical protein